MNDNSLVGQQQLRKNLIKIIETGKLSHAILLTGPQGSGKKSWGKHLARAIMCQDGQGLEPCMQCLSCRSFQNGNHPDYFLVEPDKRRIKIEQIRSIRNRFSLSGSIKVCLIVNAETMTPEASSSLLKMLEEPPPGLYFILLTEQPHLLFDTILSRCQRYMLKPLSRAEIFELLVRKRDITCEKADLLARISCGLPGQALMLADDGNFDERYEEAQTLAYKLASGGDSALQLLKWADSLAKKEDLIPFLELICFYYRDRLVQYLFNNVELLPESDEAAIRTGKPSVPGLEEAILLINKAIYQISVTNVNRRLLMESVLIMLQRRLSKCPKLSEFDSDRLAKPTTLNPAQID